MRKVGKIKWIYLGGPLLILVSCLIARFYEGSSFLSSKDEPAQQQPSSDVVARELDWRLLQTFDYQTGVVPDPLKPFVDAHVKIPGFAVPLTDNLNEVSEFLLVPNQMACIHVPPPPPNLIIFVRVSPPLKLEEIYGPLWTTGDLKLNKTESVYGSASWEMLNAKIEPYRF